VSEESTVPDLVAIVRETYTAASRRDMDAATRFYAPGAVVDLSDQGMGVFLGIEAIRTFLDDWWGTYECFEYHPEEIVHLGQGVVLGIHTQVARLRGASGDIRLRDGYVLLFEGDLVVRLTSYSDVNAARAAAERIAKERG
jgi:hypothetical protein